MAVQDWLAGGARRRLERALSALEQAFARPVDEKTWPQAAKTYRDVVQLALRVDPSVAVGLVRVQGARIPTNRYGEVFSAKDEGWLARQLSRDDRDVLAVVFDLAIRLQLRELQCRARDRIGEVLDNERDVEGLVGHLRRCNQVGLLEIATLTTVLQRHLAHSSFGYHEGLWQEFLAGLPESELPDLFDVHHFLGNGVKAITLADTPERCQQALELCLQSPNLEDVLAGLEFARTHKPDLVARFEERAGDLRFEEGEYAAALDHYERASCTDRMCDCYEHLGRYQEAMDLCPAGQPDRLARLAEPCMRDVEELVEREEFLPAAQRISQILSHLYQSRDDTHTMSNSRAEATRLQAWVLEIGRESFEERVRRAGHADRRPLFLAWSRFEEECGQLLAGAHRAEQGGDVHRANRLYLVAGQPGHAVRVLKSDNTLEGLRARAEILENAGDPLGAAQLYDQAGDGDKAVTMYERARDFRGVTKSMRARLGDDAIEDPRFVDCLRRVDVDELGRFALEVLERRGKNSGAFAVLRALLNDNVLSPPLRDEVSRAMDTLHEKETFAFQERAEALVAQAHTDVDKRYARIWGLDLGTTYCAAAIFDTTTKQPVVCPWKGAEQFPATLSLDDEGNEVVGLYGEETFKPGLQGTIGAAKRAMGTGKTMAIHNRSYRPEEVAARLIGHARGMVEDFLTAQVRERLEELAHAELGCVEPEWLSWAEAHHEMRITRPEVYVTVPAFFPTTATNATRDACEIAGVEKARLLHEPTAACITAVRERRLDDLVLLVVDLGAGTLDVSLVDVGDGVYDVKEVEGDNHFGGRDFDAVISDALVARLEAEGVQVGATGRARERVEAAAEYLKVVLSAQTQASYSMPGLVAGRDVVLELTRDELAEILAGPLGKLRESCQRIKKKLRAAPQHLVLIGGPMLSPLVSETIEQTFGLRATAVSNPRTAVARGAAIRAAVITGQVSDVVLSDVTPFALGIKARDSGDNETFSVIVGANTTIPTTCSRTYTTHEDDQTSVHVEVFNGEIDARSKIGQFELKGIPKAPKGKPNIEVVFDLDAAGVLTVSARDVETNRENAVTIHGSTLLSPQEVRELAERHRVVAQRRKNGRELKDVLRQLQELCTEAAEHFEDVDASWREFRGRQQALRKPSTPLDAETNQALFEMFSRSSEIDTELMVVHGPLSDLERKARQYLERSRHTDIGADLIEGRHLEGELSRFLDRVRAVEATLARWNAVLVRLAVAEPDLLKRFRNCHDAGRFAAAIAAVDMAPERFSELADVRKYLRCCAEVGDADRYRAVLTTYAEALHVVPVEQIEAFLARAEEALVRVAVSSESGTGFMVSERLVVTNKHWLVDWIDGEWRTVETDRIEIRVGEDIRSAERLYLPESSRANIAMLGLADSVVVDPLHLGHPALVRVGDSVHAVGANGLEHGIVNGFESFTEQGVHLVRTDLRMPPSCGGGPLFNDLGEVIGILTRSRHIGVESAGGGYALAVDVLDPLLAEVRSGV